MAFLDSDPVKGIDNVEFCEDLSLTELGKGFIDVWDWVSVLLSNSV